MPVRERRTPLPGSMTLSGLSISAFADVGVAELGEIDPVLYYNVGVLYQDMGKPRDAIKAYEAALMADENLADACYNLALLYEEIGWRKDAIRNMARYRRLTASA